MTNRADAPKMIRGVLNKDMLRDWIVMVSNPALGNDQCWQFHVMHRSEEGLDCIHSQKLDRSSNAEARDLSIEQLVQFVDEQSLSTACSYRLIQTFKVTAHVDDDEHSAARSQFTFTIQPPKNIADDPGEVEEANEKGTLMLMQRLADTAIGSKDKSMHKLLDVTMEMVVENQKTIQGLVADMLQAKVTTEALLDRKAEREWNIEKERKDREIFDKLSTVALNIGGNYLVSTLMKKGMLPTEPIIDFNKPMPSAPQAPQLVQGEKSDLHKLIDSMTPEQMIQFVGNMTVEQQKEMMPAVEKIIPQLPQEKLMKFMALYQEAQKAAPPVGDAANPGASDIEVKESPQ